MSEERICKTCIKRKTMFCPNSFKCYATKDKPFYQNSITLLDENKRLKDLLDSQAYKDLDIKAQQLDTYKRVFNEIRNIINYYGITPEENDNSTLRHILRDMSKILDKVNELSRGD